MMAGAVYLALAGGWMFASLQKVMRVGLVGIRQGGVDFQPGRAAWALAEVVAWPLAGLFFACMVAALASQMLLGSFQFNASLMAPKFSRMNPANYVKRIFGTQGLAELGKSLMKVILVGAIGWWMLSSYAREIASLGAEDIGGAITHTGHLAIIFLLVLSAGLLLVAGVDVPLQMIQLMQKLRMSKQEVKDELKRSEE